ncbi:MAG: hypothetical protein ABI175_29985 [Polyangiales bacterium]
MSGLVEFRAQLLAEKIIRDDQMGLGASATDARALLLHLRALLPSESLGDLSEELARRMQMYQHHYAKMAMAMSNMLKKSSQTQGSIIANMK